MKKILIIRFSSIGDIVLTSPVVRCLKKQVPGAEIHYLTKKQFHPVISENPYIDRIWLFEKNFDELLPLLRAEKFDFIADLHKNLRSRFVILKLGRPSGTFPKLNLRKWILVNLKINLLPEIHIVDRYFNAVSHFNLNNDGEGLNYLIPKGEEVDLSGVLPSPGKDFIAFSIGGKHFTKILPEDKVTEICNQVRTPVILLGGPEDSDRGARIAVQAGNHVINGCGKYSVNQSASIIRQSGKVITNDTGMMHIAAAFRKPIISIWGSTVPSFGMYPYLPAATELPAMIIEVAGLKCRPCSKIGFEKCPKGHFRCMNDQDISKIVRSLQE